MSRLSKREVKEQRDLMNLISTGLSTQYWERDKQIEYIYENFHPSMIDNQTENGAFYTPFDLSGDVSIFCGRGHVVDVCAGIGSLMMATKLRDSYNKQIKSMTCIELNPKAVEIGKKLLPEANWINANVFDEQLWKDLTKDLPDNRFCTFLSNPPFGRDTLKRTAPFLNMSGERDLMVLELCLRYSKSGYFILPSQSVPFAFRPSWEENPERWSQKWKRFIKATKDFRFTLQNDGIDGKMYSDQFKGLQSISIEAADVMIYPWSLDYEADSLQLRYPEYCK